MEGGTTVPLTPSPGPTQAPDPIETDVPDVPDDGGAVIYETYYLTIRWYYYSYYWTVRMATSTVTSTEVTTTTVVSVTDTDRDSASSSLEALSESVVEAQTTPEEATTARAAATQSPDETESESPRVTASGPETTSRRPLPTAAGGDEPPGGGSGAGGLQAPSLYVWMGALGAGLMGIGMVWL